MSFFDFIESVLVDTVAEVVTLPFKPVEAVLNVVNEVVDPGSENFSDIRRESFPNSIFRSRD